MDTLRRRGMHRPVPRLVDVARLRSLTAAPPVPVRLVNPEASILTRFPGMMFPSNAMKLSDYIVGRLADWGVRDIFLVVGGGAMHLNDSIAREPRLRYICNHLLRSRSNAKR